MSVEMWKKADSNLITVHVEDKLEEEDYEKFVPEIDKAVAEHGKIKVLFEMDDFHGWKAGALWKDLKFDLKHFDDIEKVAFVGEKKWQKGMAVFCKPFTTADVKYFEQGEEDEAREWLLN